MEAILEYSHLAPTCPFSLKCEMMEEDYLVLNELPHLFVAGECEVTGVRDFVSREGDRRVRMVSVRRGEMVLIDVDSFDVQEY
jgi:DNA polymerase II small subunit/DNA polymerase delta subunit B